MIYVNNLRFRLLDTMSTVSDLLERISFEIKTYISPEQETNITKMALENNATTLQQIQIKM